MKTKITIALISTLFLAACGGFSQKKQSNKLILKASNNMYVTLAADSALIANQSDSTKAQLFEKVDEGNGKIALKTSFGKYVTDDRYLESKLFANRNVANEWEQFEIISLPNGKVNLKSSTGKFVCGDQTLGGVLIANRTAASDWETFIVEYK